MLLGVAIAASLPEAARIIRTCVPLLPGGPTACTVGNPEEECSLTRLAVGNTNRLYCLRRAVTGDRYLVREFGASSALRFDRDAENAVFAQLSEHGLSPALIATFPGGGAGGAGGRIEGWLEGGPVTVEACRSPTVYGKVAEALAELHVFEPAAVNAEGAWPLAWGWRAVGAWLPAAIERQRELAGASEGGEDGEDGGAYAERVAALRLSDVRGRLEALRELLEAKEPPRCYCHNDLSNTNLHLEPISGELRLVDFEYGGLNYRGFDLATHLSHWAGGASDGRYQCAVHLPCHLADSPLHVHPATPHASTGVGGSTPRPSATLASPARRPVPHTAPHPLLLLHYSMCLVCVCERRSNVRRPPRAHTWLGHLL
jgi:thiamine kinase-like enzyme